MDIHKLSLFSLFTPIPTTLPTPSIHNTHFLRSAPIPSYTSTSSSLPIPYTNLHAHKLPFPFLLKCFLIYTNSFIDHPHIRHTLPFPSLPRPTPYTHSHTHTLSFPHIYTHSPSFLHFIQTCPHPPIHTNPFLPSTHHISSPLPCPLLRGDGTADSEGGLGGVAQPGAMWEVVLGV